jgi:hypothetical protein
MRELNNKEVENISGAYAFGDFTKAVLSGLGALFANLFKDKIQTWPEMISPRPESSALPIKTK